MKGSTLINQLASESGEYILTKNPNISKLELLVKEYNYLVSHNVSDSDQFHELRERFISQMEETKKSLDQLDEKVERLNKIASALEDLHSDSPIDAKVAYQILEELNTSFSANPKEIEKQVVEVSIERKALKEKFDSIVKDFTQYEKLERHAEARRANQILYGKIETKEDLTK